MKFIIVMLLVLVTASMADVHTEYYSSGKKRLEGNISNNGLKSDIWNEFYENGRLKSVTVYGYRCITSHIDYSTTGKLLSSANYNAYGVLLDSIDNKGNTYSYVDGILRYKNKKDMWTVRCDEFNPDTGRKYTYCGQVTYNGNRAGVWVGTEREKTDSLIYALENVYDTATGELLVVKTWYNDRNLLPDDYQMIDRGLTAEITVSITEPNRNTTYGKYVGSSEYKLQDQLVWSESHVWSHTDTRAGLTYSNCPFDNDTRITKTCGEHNSFGSYIRLLERGFNQFK